MPGPTDDIWDVMSTARAIRRFRPDPVDDALLQRCLEAATWAPSGGNRQPWRIVVMTSPASRRALAEGAAHTLAGVEKLYKLQRPEPDDDSTAARNARATFALHDGAADVPAAVLFCMKELPMTPDFVQGGSVYPAMENFLLAARACGLGACMTGWHIGAQQIIRDAVGVPDDWHLAGLVVVGWPEGRHGPLRRKPVDEVAARDRWDVPFAAAVD
jgi:nitroreductase